MLLKVFVQDNCPTCSRLKEEILGMDMEEVIKLILLSDDTIGEFEKYKVLRTPVSILVDKDENEIDRFYGVKSKQEILEFIS